MENIVNCPYPECSAQQIHSLDPVHTFTLQRASCRFNNRIVEDLSFGTPLSGTEARIAGLLSRGEQLLLRLQLRLRT